MSPIDYARQCVYEYTIKHLDPTDNIHLELDDVYVVWFCYIAGGWKALLSTNLPDGMYYEVTAPANKDAVYLDAYKRFDQAVIKD